MGCWTFFFKTFFFVSFFFLVLLLAPSLPPAHVKFSEFHIPPSKPLEGKLSLNTFLNNTEKLFENQIKGPEAFTILGGELYFSVHNGYVLKLFRNKLIPIVKFGKPCENWWEEHKCGRPLGLTTTRDDKLVVADAYYGIFEHNVRTGKSVSLVDKDAVINGKKPRIFNGVVAAHDGMIYWTDSSPDFPLHNGVYSLLADPNGRLIKYDPESFENTVLLDNLYFPNGVALSFAEDFLLVAETGLGRIRRVYLKGRKKYQSDIFAEGLPGLPDNLRLNGKGGFYVALNVARDNNNPTIIEILSPFPGLRKVLTRLLAMVDWVVESIDNIYSNYYTKRLAHIIGHFEMMSAFYPVRTTFIELDEDGNIIDSFHGLDGTSGLISDIITFEGDLYLGSPYNNYLGKISLSKFNGKIIDNY